MRVLINFLWVKHLRDNVCVQESSKYEICIISTKRPGMLKNRNSLLITIFDFMGQRIVKITRESEITITFVRLADIGKQ